MSLFDKILTIVRYKQDWHICWTINVPGRLPGFGDGTYTIKPRLTHEAILGLRSTLATDSGAIGTEVKPEQISITGLARIGR